MKSRNPSAPVRAHGRVLVPRTRKAVRGSSLHRTGSCSGKSPKGAQTYLPWVICGRDPYHLSYMHPSKLMTTPGNILFMPDLQLARPSHWFDWVPWPLGIFFLYSLTHITACKKEEATGAGNDVAQAFWCTYRGGSNIPGLGTLRQSATSRRSGGGTGGD